MKQSEFGKVDLSRISERIGLINIKQVDQVTRIITDKNIEKGDLEKYREKTNIDIIF